MRRGGRKYELRARNVLDMSIDMRGGSRKTSSNVDIKVDKSNTSHLDAVAADDVMKEYSSWMQTSSDKVPL